MYDVAICDDQLRDRKFLRKDICNNKKYGNQLRIHEYGSGCELLKDMEKINFSIIFMDIQMTGLDGVLTAEEIRRKDDIVVLVFCTGYMEPTIHSIEVQPYRYIKKNMPDAMRQKYIADSLEKMAAIAQMPSIEAKIDRKKIILRPDDIVYIEKSKKYLRVHLSASAKVRHQIEELKEDVRAYEKLETLYEMLKPFGFGYPHNSYMINFKFLMSCEVEEIKMEGFPDITLKITRSKAVEFNNLKRMFLMSKYNDR